MMGAELLQQEDSDHKGQPDVCRAAAHANEVMSNLQEDPLSSCQGPAANDLIQQDTAAAIRPRTRRVSEHGCGYCGLAAADVSSVIEARALQLQALSLLPGEVPGQEAALYDGPAGLSPAAAGSRPEGRPAAAAPSRFVSPFAGFAGLHCLEEQEQQMEQEFGQEPEQELRQELAQQQQSPRPSLKQGSVTMSDAVASCQLLDADGTIIPVFAVVSISKTLPAA